MQSKPSAHNIQSLASIVSLHHVGDEAFARAWLLTYGPNRHFSLPLQACHEIINSPEILPVPGMARYALGVLQWRNQWLPLIDINSLITGQLATQMPNSYYLIVAYRNMSGSISYGALALRAFPQVVEVEDDAICRLPRHNFDWKNIAKSCFRHLNNRVPVVDGSLLFSQFHGVLGD